MTADHSTPQYCYKHPTVETGLRCNRCDRPICSRCAVHTETGYRCKECIRGQQKIFDTARWYDFVIAILVAFFLSLIGGLLCNVLGYFTILLAFGAGIVIAEAVRISLRRRRNRLLFKLVAAAVVIGGLLPLVPGLVSIFLSLGMNNLGLLAYGGSLYSVIWSLVYSVIATSTCYYRLSGLQLR